MKLNFELALELILKHEGGYVNHPRDPGGATNMGITMRTYQHYFGTEKDVDDLKNIPYSHVHTIYYNGYWKTVRGDELPGGIDVAVFDMAVNAGPRRATKMLQQVLGVVVDGVIGEQTLGVAKKKNPVEVIKMYTKAREDYYRSLKAFEVFGKGWLNRNNSTMKYSLDMVQGSKSSVVTEKKLPKGSLVGYMKNLFK